MAKDTIKTGGHIYEALQSVRLDGVQYVIAECPDAEAPFICWRRSVDREFGEESYMLPLFTSDYVEAMRMFARQLSVAVDGLELSRVYRGSRLVDQPLDEQACVPNGLESDLKGKVVAIKTTSLFPEHRTCTHQLMLATGGVGCPAKAVGQTVYGVNLYSRAQEQWDRGDILGVVQDSALPKWARDRLEILEKRYSEKVSVLAVIREAKKNPIPIQKEPQTNKLHKIGPEL